MNLEAFTLGIEEEFQIVDPITRDLKSHIEEILADGKMILMENIKPEMHQSVVEVGTDICKTISDARREVIKLRSTLDELARKKNLRIAAAGTHPFARWDAQKITEHERYRMIVEDMQQVARANLIFGLHVHVGMPDRETAIQVMNTARYFIPHIFALSTNSPFWMGSNTGFKSYRIKIFERFPRTGIPDTFDSLSDFEEYVKLLVKTKCIDNPKRIWWDIRLHPNFNTLEWRVCDIPMRVDETISLAALMQAVTVKLFKLFKQNLGFRMYRTRLLNENRWRAARYGIQGKLIDFGKEKEVDMTTLIDELLEFVDDVVDDLDSRKEVEYVKEIVKMGTGADRQLDVWNKTHDLQNVVDLIINETSIGIR